MKIALVNPNTYLEDIIHPPLGLALLATICKQYGYKVHVFDLPILKWSDEKAANEITKFQPDIVGFTVTTKIYASAIEIAKILKKNIPQAKIIMGGPHPTFAGYNILERIHDIDFIILFEAENSLFQLLQALRDNKSHNHIPGLGFRINQKTVINLPAPPIGNLDLLPIPDREFFPLAKYLTRDDETTVLTARGCPNHCAFCSTTRMGRRLRARSAKNVADEVRYVLNLGFRSIFFSDDTFTYSEKRVHELCNEFQKISGKWRWTCNMRLQDARPEILEPMAKSGCYRVFVGVESSSTKLLERINKRCPANQAIELSKIIKNYGVEIHASFLFGLPGETEKTIMQTIKYAKKMNPDMISFNILTPYPGTELYENPGKYGIIMPDRFWFEKKDWYEKPVSGTSAISPENLIGQVKKAYVEFLDE